MNPGLRILLGLAFLGLAFYLYKKGGKDREDED